LLGVSLVPEITVQSVPDATSSPSVDQEVPSVSHPVPFRFSFDPPSDPASVDAFIKAYPNLPGYHMWSTWDRLMAVSTYGPPGSEEDDEPDSGWDFSGLGDPSAMRGFMTACDYCLSDCSDDGHNFDDKDCGPSHEYFHVDLGGLDEGNHLGMPEDGDPPRPAPRVDILQELVVVPVPAGGQDAQLEQIREMEARLDEEAGQLVQLRQNIEQEWVGRAPVGEARHLALDVQHRIADDARCWGEGKDATLRSRHSLQSLVRRRQNGQGHPSVIRHQMKGRDAVIPPCGLVQLGGPRAIRSIVTGPAWPLRVTGLICKGIPVITVCNPALWEYSRDNLGV
jgi:hypothetical protein